MTITRLILSFALGFVWSIGGMTILTWEYWVSLILILLLLVTFEN